MEESLYDFGMIGLGTMGSNLLLNMADHGFSVIGYDKNPEKTIAFEASATKGTTVKGVNTLEEMIAQLKVPRKLMMLVLVRILTGRKSTINSYGQYLHQEELSL